MLDDVCKRHLTHRFTKDRVKDYEFRIVFLKVFESVAETVDLAVVYAFPVPSAFWRWDEPGERHYLVRGMD